MMKFLLGVFLFVVPIVGYTNNLYVDINIASKHFCDCGDDLNEENFGLGVTYELNDFAEAKIGFYENSFYQHSNYAGVNFFYTPPTYGYSERWIVEPGVMIGLVSGYQQTANDALEISNGVMPLVVPNIKLGYDPVNFMVGVTAVRGGGVFTLQAQFRGW